MKISSIEFHVNPSSGSPVYTCGQTDRQTDRTKIVGALFYLCESAYQLITILHTVIPRKNRLVVSKHMPNSPWHMEVRFHIWYSSSLCLFHICHKFLFRYLALLFVRVIFTFDTLTMASVKLTVLWDVASCSLVERYQLLEYPFLHPEDTDITFLKKRLAS